MFGRRSFSLIIVTSALAVFLGLGSCGGEQLAPSGPALAPSQGALEDALFAEFARLGIDPAKVAATPPSGDDNAVFDLSGDVIDPDGTGGGPATSIQLKFTERAIGDYDQNGEVNIADLAPLGQRLGVVVRYDDPASRGGITWWPTGDPDEQSATDPPPPDSGLANWRNARVDGDGNGEININDLTPIAAHWQERLDGYRVYRRAQADVDFTLLPNAEDPLLAFTLPRPPVNPYRPVRNYLTDLPPAPGVYEYYVAAYDAGSGLEGTPSNLFSVSYNVSANQEPVAVLLAAPSNGDVPLDVLLDGSGSSDPDGSIVLYEFDWDNDGVYDQQGAQTSVQHTYDAAGTYLAKLRVTDDAVPGLSDIAITVITVGMAGGPLTISGTIEELLADWPDPFTSPVTGPKAGIVVNVSDATTYTLVGQSAPSAADGSFSITGLNAAPGNGVYVWIDEEAEGVELLNPIPSGDPNIIPPGVRCYLIYDFQADTACYGGFLDANGFQHP